MISLAPHGINPNNIILLFFNIFKSILLVMVAPFPNNNLIFCILVLMILPEWVKYFFSKIP